MSLGITEKCFKWSLSEEILGNFNKKEKILNDRVLGYDSSNGDGETIVTEIEYFD